MNYLLKIFLKELDIVDHACNPSYLGSGNLEERTKGQRAGDIVQVVDTCLASMRPSVPIPVLQKKLKENTTVSKPTSTLRFYSSKIT
jgi:hypothetical protein